MSFSNSLPKINSVINNKTYKSNNKTDQKLTHKERKSSTNRNIFNKKLNLSIS